MLKDDNIKFSILIPVYNEEKIVEKTIEDLKLFLNIREYVSEIIVINDGSTDKTKEIIEKIEGIKVINHPYNKGYGASLKTGARSAQYDWLLFYDGDGQFNPQYISDLLKYTDKYEMVVGVRQGANTTPWIRKPGKTLLRWVANFLVEKKIPDLNCGFRLIKKDKLLQFAHILPNGFSLTTTITLAFFKEGLDIKYIPVEMEKRVGKSSVRPKDAVTTFILICRVILLFSPLKIFLPISATLFAGGSIFFIWDLATLNVNDTTILLFLSAIMIFFFGLLADQISSLRREMK